MRDSDINIDKTKKLDAFLKKMGADNWQSQDQKKLVKWMVLYRASMEAEGKSGDLDIIEFLECAAEDKIPINGFIKFLTNNKGAIH